MTFTNVEFAEQESAERTNEAVILVVSDVWLTNKQRIRVLLSMIERAQEAIEELRKENDA